MPGDRNQVFEAHLTGRDTIQLSLDLNGTQISSARLKALGCLSCLKLVDEWRSKLNGDLTKVPLPSGADHSSMLLREVLLKARGAWHLPYEEDELCHCRKILTATVDMAVVAGFETVEKVGRETTAGTSCGTCRDDIQKVINYRKSV